MEPRYDDYSGITRFKDVPIGCYFRFTPAPNVPTFYRPEYMKTSARKYRSPIIPEVDFTVGSINAKVEQVRRGAI